MVDLKDLDECRDCGAVVYSRPRHRRWHEELEKVKRTADDAEMYAMDAQEKLGN